MPALRICALIAIALFLGGCCGPDGGRYREASRARREEFRRARNEYRTDVREAREEFRRRAYEARSAFRRSLEERHRWHSYYGPQ